MPFAQTPFGSSAQPELTRWVPENYIRLRDGLCQLGEAKISGWIGNELDARRYNAPPEPPWLWRVSENKELQYFIITKDNEIKLASESEAQTWWNDIEPVITQEWHDEIAAGDRWKACLDQMRNLLVNKTITAIVLKTNGDLYSIPVDRWLSEQGGTLLRSGVADFKIPNGFTSIPINGPIILDSDFLKNDRGSKLELGDDDTERDTDTNQQEQLDTSRFPYLAFMERAALEAPFNSKGRTPKKVIENWLREHWPPELGTYTETKISTMATFLRRPDDEKGGLH